MRSLIRELYEAVSVWALIGMLIWSIAAWLAGRAIAQTWRPFWHLLIYMALLGAALSFLRFALFEETLLSTQYAADTLYLILVSALAWRITRAAQMTTQYYWLYERTSPLTWRARAAGAENPGGTRSNSG
jgi:hypothetical protein